MMYIITHLYVVKDSWSFEILKQSQQHILGFMIWLCDYVLIKKDICN
jgi:hypothetical protein